MMLFGYWQLGNRQQFFNDMPLRRHRNEVANPQHALIDYTQGYNYTILLLVYFVIFFFFEFNSIVLKKLGQLFNVFKQMTVQGEPFVDNEWNVMKTADEHLGRYWECLKGMDQKQWYVNEAHL